MEWVIGRTLPGSGCHLQRHLMRCTRTEPEVIVHRQCEVNRSHGQDESRASCMYRLSLSDGFDERAQALYDNIRASAALQPHTAVCAA